MARFQLLLRVGRSSRQAYKGSNLVGILYDKRYKMSINGIALQENNINFAKNNHTSGMMKLAYIVPGALRVLRKLLGLFPFIYEHLLLQSF
jgi:Zn/Cd-binding protein ZinT